MTYGWAILIIAVVLAALFELGVFNPMTFAPKASPGSCQVVRPEGAGTTNFISLEGECQDELPQYVAQFNGNNNYITSNIIGLPVGAAQRTVTMWVYTSDLNQQRAFFGYGITQNYQNFYALIAGSAGGNCGVATTSNSIWTDMWGCTMTGPGLSPLPAIWIFFTMEYNGSYSISYTGYNNELHGPFTSVNSPFTANTPYTPFYIGDDYQGYTGGFQGSIANVQVYNTALSSNDIKALYQEGIGGAPIKIQSLVAWYPLNGNANDYSGNGNNGVPTGVTYTSNWYSGYSAP